MKQLDENNRCKDPNAGKSLIWKEWNSRLPTSSWEPLGRVTGDGAGVVKRAGISRVFRPRRERHSSPYIPLSSSWYQPSTKLFVLGNAPPPAPIRRHAVLSFGHLLQSRTHSQPLGVLLGDSVSHEHGFCKWWHTSGHLLFHSHHKQSISGVQRRPLDRGVRVVSGHKSKCCFLTSCGTSGPVISS